MAGSLGDQNDGLGGKRPAQTIEGTATEIVEEQSAAESTDAEQLPHDGEAAPKGAAEGEPAEAGAAPPRRGATMPELRGFVTHLTAGLLGGRKVLTLIFVPVRNLLVVPIQHLGLAKLLELGDRHLAHSGRVQGHCRQ